MTLTGVMSSGDTTNAYIDGTLYSQGEVLPHGFRITEIRSEGITISDSSAENLYFVPVGTSGGIEKLDKKNSEQQIEEAVEEVGAVSFVGTPDEQEESAGLDIDFESGFKMVLGIALLLIGFLMSLIGQIWYLVASFKTSVWWGLGVFFVPFVSLVFLFMHWDVAKRPFLISLIGTLLVYAGVFMMPGIFNSY